MTRLERIARDLAAVLSPQGEADWPSFLSMAEDVGTQFHKQFAEVMGPVEVRATRQANSRHDCA